MIHTAMVKLVLSLTLAAETGSAPPKVDGPQFQLQLLQLKRCKPPAGVSDSERAWVGFSVEVRSKTRGLFVGPRDFTLEKQGIILDARHVNAPLLQGCLPLLRPKQLNASDKPLRGFVLFEVPARLQKDDLPLTLAYRPTRWGGAPRLEISVPACLDQCDSARTGDRQQRGNSQPAARH